MDPNDRAGLKFHMQKTFRLQDFTGGDGWRWVPNDFTFTLSDDQITAIQLLSTEGKQDYEVCVTVLSTISITAIVVLEMPLVLHFLMEQQLPLDKQL